MRTYELCLVLDPGQKRGEQDKLLAKIKEEVEKLEGRLEKQEEWDRRELSYPIKRLGEGVFFILRLALPPGVVAGLEKKIKTEESILRYLLVREEKRGEVKKN